MARAQVRKADESSGISPIRRAKRTAGGRKKASAPPNGQAPASSPEIKIGSRLKHARLVQKLRLRELADQVGCSESFISKLENDKVRPSLSMLHKIVGILDINIAALFSDPPMKSPVLVVRADNRPIIRTDPLARGPGIALERLVAAAPSGLIEANIHCVDPGGHTDGAIDHIGEEIGFVLEGKLELTVDGVVYPLSTGDCFFFHSDLKHSYRNPGKVTARVLWVCTPPTF
ncbi:MAG TPA: cupin domain-containing protein [Vineibacter sp.]|nr:cupin domain-containing protein [Vineibacter sp.]